MFNNAYHRYLEKHTGEVFECGEYRYASRFLGLKKTGIMKIPMEMYWNGLLVMGCQKSYRRRFTQHYAKLLVKSGVRVLYITDALSEEQYRAEFEIENFTKHIGLNELDSDLVHMEELSGIFNREPFDNGVLLSVVHFKAPCMLRTPEICKDYNAKLIKLLNEVANDDISKREYGTDKPAFVVVIDEDSPLIELDEKAFKQALYSLKIRRAGPVVCGYPGERYRNVANTFGHYVFFRIKDPTFDLEGFDVFKGCCFRAGQGIGNKYKHILNQRDLTGLEPKEFYYTMADVCGWSNKVSFDAGGCECCKLPPEDYYGYKKPNAT